MFKLQSQEKAKEDGFAIFNNGEHLCIDVPDGHFTITCRTSEGKKITFAFCPYGENKPPQCVDVQYHSSGVVKMNGTHACPVQEVICFTPGYDVFRSKLDDEKPHTLTAILLVTKEEREAGKQG